MQSGLHYNVRCQASLSVSEKRMAEQPIYLATQVDEPGGVGVGRGEKGRRWGGFGGGCWAEACLGARNLFTELPHRLYSL